MKLKLSLPFLLTFLLLLLVMMELHEIVHISVGRLICGCWGPRDFNVWSLCESCEGNPLGWLSTLAGPVFSFVVMYLGMFWLSSSNSNKQALGFSFIFANIPFGRITTVMMGGGDEMVVLRHFLSDDLSHPQIRIIGSIILLAIGLPPLIKAYRVISNEWAWLYIIGFMTLPLVFLLSYLLIGLNRLLSQGFLSESWIMGTSIFITIHTILAAVLLMVFRKNLLLLNSKS